MKINELNELKKQATAKYDEALALAKKELDETLQAIDKVSSLLGHSTNNKTNTIEGKSNSSGQYGSLVVNLKKAVEATVGTFDKNDLIEAMGYTPIESSFDGCLRRLVQKRFVKVISKGSGRRATTYKKVRKDEFFDL